MIRPRGRHRRPRSALSLALSALLALGLLGGAGGAAFAVHDSSSAVVTAAEVRDALEGIPDLMNETDPNGDIAALLDNVGLPDATVQQSETVLPGIVAFPADHVANVVQATRDGGRALTVIGDAAAPEQFTYTFDLPDGLALKLAADGSADLVDVTGTVIFDQFVAAPWATDANGRQVGTTYRIHDTNGDGRSDDSTLVQVVEHRAEGVAYPVVADPHFAWYSSGVVITLSQFETAVLGASSALLPPVAAGLPLTMRNALVFNAVRLQVYSAYLGAVGGRCLWVWVPWWNPVRINFGWYGC